MLPTFVGFWVMTVVYYCVFYGMPQYLEGALGFGTGQVGALMVPLAGVSLVANPVVARVLTRVGTKVGLIVGAVWMAVGSCLALLLAGFSHPALVLVVCGVLGVPYCISTLGYAKAMYDEAPAAKIGVATGMLQTCRHAGGAVATIVLSLVFSAGLGPSGLADMVVVMVLGWLAHLADTLLLPYFGDAASYLSAQTETVQSRQGVRNRGLALLKALHEDPEYDRVIVIAHSLGSVLAYDLLHILWREVGPTKDNPPDHEAQAALAAVDAFSARAPTDLWAPEDVAQYQRLQWAAFEALRQQKGMLGAKSGWKVSDLITLGTPLSSAEFLITDGRADFSRMKQERVLPTAPPQPYDEDNGALHPSGPSGEVAHHAAVFSTVRWTNLFDRFDSPLFFLGDAISGPVSGAERFGPGIRDVDVPIIWGRLGWRLFTHNLYWVDTAAEGDPPASHIVAFREAVGLERLGA